MQDSPGHRETIIAHTGVIKSATHVRSTLIQSSLATLQSLGHGPSYLERVAPQHRAAIMETMAPTWLPMEVALAHYQACEDLQLSNEQMLAIGVATSDRVQGSFMETLTRAARSLGVTPWVLLKRFDVLWGRVVQGGSIELTRVGPKDLTIEVCGLPLVRLPYFRTAFCGVVSAGYRHVGVTKAFVRVSKWLPGSDRFVMRAAWV